MRFTMYRVHRRAQVRKFGFVRFGFIMLNFVEVRVLGSLIEKEGTTPEYYPLSLNALVNACNQKSNRDPAVQFDEETVRSAIESLREKGYATVISGVSRVVKFGQRISETLNMGRRELAVLCVLLLRGPQTLGEIKDRSERMYSFADLSETERVLEKLSEWPGIPLVTKLARQPGQKEARYAHLLAGEPVIAEPTEGSATVFRSSPLEETVQQLRAEVDDLKRRLEELENALR